MSDLSKELGKPRISSTTREIMDEVFAWVSQYEGQFKKQVPLYVVNRRWGIRVRRITGASIRNALERDGRFVFALLETGASSVGIRSTQDVQIRILTLLDEGPKTVPQIMEGFKNAGLTHAHVLEELQRLDESGRIVLDEGLYFIDTAP